MTQENTDLFGWQKFTSDPEWANLDENEKADALHMWADDVAKQIDSRAPAEDDPYADATEFMMLSQEFQNTYAGARKQVYQEAIHTQIENQKRMLLAIDPNADPDEYERQILSNQAVPFFTKDETGAVTQAGPPVRNAAWRDFLGRKRGYVLSTEDGATEIPYETMSSNLRKDAANSLRGLPKDMLDRFGLDSGELEETYLANEQATRKEWDVGLSDEEFTKMEQDLLDKKNRLYDLLRNDELPPLAAGRTLPTAVYTKDIVPNAMRRGVPSPVALTRWEDTDGETTSLDYGAPDMIAGSRDLDRWIGSGDENKGWEVRSEDVDGVEEVLNGDREFVITNGDLVVNPNLLLGDKGKKYLEAIDKAPATATQKLEARQAFFARNEYGRSMREEFVQKLAGDLSVNDDFKKVLDETLADPEGDVEQAVVKYRDQFHGGKIIGESLASAWLGMRQLGTNTLAYWGSSDKQEARQETMIERQKEIDALRQLGTSRGGGTGSRLLGMATEEAAWLLPTMASGMVGRAVSGVVTKGIATGVGQLIERGALKLTQRKLSNTITRKIAEGTSKLLKNSDRIGEIFGTAQLARGRTESANFGDNYAQALKQMGYSDISEVPVEQRAAIKSEALRSAFASSYRDGVVTGLVTATFGAKFGLQGAERIASKKWLETVQNAVQRKGFKEAFKSGLGTFVKGSFEEGVEESTDYILSTVLDPQNIEAIFGNGEAEMTAGEFFDGLVQTFTDSMVVGGVGEAIPGVFGKTIRGGTKALSSFIRQPLDIAAARQDYQSYYDLISQMEASGTVPETLKAMRENTEKLVKTRSLEIANNRKVIGKPRALAPVAPAPTLAEAETTLGKAGTATAPAAVTAPTPADADVDNLLFESKANAAAPTEEQTAPTEGQATTIEPEATALAAKHKAVRAEVTELQKQVKAKKKEENADPAEVASLTASVASKEKELKGLTEQLAQARTTTRNTGANAPKKTTAPPVEGAAPAATTTPPVEGAAPAATATTTTATVPETYTPPEKPYLEGVTFVRRRQKPATEGEPFSDGDIESIVGVASLVAEKDRTPEQKAWVAGPSATKTWTQKFNSGVARFGEWLKKGNTVAVLGALDTLLTKDLGKTAPTQIKNKVAREVEISAILEAIDLHNEANPGNQVALTPAQQALVRDMTPEEVASNTLQPPPSTGAPTTKAPKKPKAEAPVPESPEDITQRLVNTINAAVDGFLAEVDSEEFVADSATFAYNPDPEANMLGEFSRLSREDEEEGLNMINMGDQTWEFVFPRPYVASHEAYATAPDATAATDQLFIFGVKSQIEAIRGVLLDLVEQNSGDLSGLAQDLGDLLEQYKGAIFETRFAEAVVAKLAEAKFDRDYVRNSPFTGFLKSPLPALKGKYASHMGSAYAYSQAINELLPGLLKSLIQGSNSTPENNPTPVEETEAEAGADTSAPPTSDPAPEQEPPKKKRGRPAKAKPDDAELTEIVEQQKEVVAAKAAAEVPTEKRTALQLMMRPTEAQDKLSEKENKIYTPLVEAALSIVKQMHQKHAVASWEVARRISEAHQRGEVLNSADEILLRAYVNHKASNGTPESFPVPMSVNIAGVAKVIFKALGSKYNGDSITHVETHLRRAFYGPKSKKDKANPAYASMLGRLHPNGADGGGETGFYKNNEEKGNHWYYNSSSTASTDAEVRSGLVEQVTLQKRLGSAVRLDFDKRGNLTAKSAKSAQLLIDSSVTKGFRLNVSSFVKLFKQKDPSNSTKEKLMGYKNQTARKLYKDFLVGFDQRYGAPETVMEVVKRQSSGGLGTIREIEAEALRVDTYHRFDYQEGANKLALNRKRSSITVKIPVATTLQLTPVIDPRNRLPKLNPDGTPVMSVSPVGEVGVFTNDVELTAQQLDMGFAPKVPAIFLSSNPPFELNPLLIITEVTVGEFVVTGVRLPPSTNRFHEWTIINRGDLNLWESRDPLKNKSRQSKRGPRIIHTAGGSADKVRTQKVEALLKEANLKRPLEEYSALFAPINYIADQIRYAWSGIMGTHVNNHTNSTIRQEADIFKAIAGHEGVQVFHIQLAKIYERQMKGVVDSKLPMFGGAKGFFTNAFIEEAKKETNAILGTRKFEQEVIMRLREISKTDLDESLTESFNLDAEDEEGNPMEYIPGELMTAMARNAFLTPVQLSEQERLAQITLDLNPEKTLEESGYTPEGRVEFITSLFQMDTVSLAYDPNLLALFDMFLGRKRENAAQGLADTLFIVYKSILRLNGLNWSKGSFLSFPDAAALEKLRTMGKEEDHAAVRNAAAKKMAQGQNSVDEVLDAYFEYGSRRQEIREERQQRDNKYYVDTTVMWEAKRGALREGRTDTAADVFERESLMDHLKGINENLAKASLSEEDRTALIGSRKLIDSKIAEINKRLKSRNIFLPREEDATATKGIESVFTIQLSMLPEAQRKIWADYAASKPGTLLFDQLVKKERWAAHWADPSNPLPASARILQRDRQQLYQDALESMAFEAEALEEVDGISVKLEEVEVDGMTMSRPVLNAPSEIVKAVEKYNAVAESPASAKMKTKVVEHTALVNGASTSRKNVSQLKRLVADHTQAVADATSIPAPKDKAGKAERLKSIKAEQAALDAAQVELDAAQVELDAAQVELDVALEKVETSSKKLKKSFNTSKLSPVFSLNPAENGGFTLGMSEEGRVAQRQAATLANYTNRVAEWDNALATLQQGVPLPEASLADDTQGVPVEMRNISTRIRGWNPNTARLNPVEGDEGLVEGEAVATITPKTLDTEGADAAFNNSEAELRADAFNAALKPLKDFMDGQPLGPNEATSLVAWVAIQGGDLAVLDSIRFVEDASAPAIRAGEDSYTEINATKFVTEFLTPLFKLGKTPADRRTLSADTSLVRILPETFKSTEETYFAWDQAFEYVRMVLRSQGAKNVAQNRATMALNNLMVSLGRESILDKDGVPTIPVFVEGETGRKKLNPEVAATLDSITQVGSENLGERVEQFIAEVDAIVTEASQPQGLPEGLDPQFIHPVKLGNAVYLRIPRGGGIAEVDLPTGAITFLGTGVSGRWDEGGIMIDGVPQSIGEKRFTDVTGGFMDLDGFWRGNPQMFISKASDRVAYMEHVAERDHKTPMVESLSKLNPSANSPVSRLLDKLRSIGFLLPKGRASAPKGPALPASGPVTKVSGWSMKLVTALRKLQSETSLDTSKEKTPYSKVLAAAVGPDLKVVNTPVPTPAEARKEFQQNPAAVPYSARFRGTAINLDELTTEAINGDAEAAKVLILEALGNSPLVEAIEFRAIGEDPIYIDSNNPGVISINPMKFFEMYVAKLFVSQNAEGNMELDEAEALEFIQNLIIQHEVAHDALERGFSDDQKAALLDAIHPRQMVDQLVLYRLYDDTKGKTIEEKRARVITDFALSLKRDDLPEDLRRMYDRMTMAHLLLQVKRGKRVLSGSESDLITQLDMVKFLGMTEEQLKNAFEALSQTFHAQVRTLRWAGMQEYFRQLSEKLNRGGTTESDIMLRVEQLKAIKSGNAGQWGIVESSTAKFLRNMWSSMRQWWAITHSPALFEHALRLKLAHNAIVNGRPDEVVRQSRLVGQKPMTSKHYVNGGIGDNRDEEEKNFSEWLSKLTLPGRNLPVSTVALPTAGLGVLGAIQDLGGIISYQDAVAAAKTDAEKAALNEADWSFTDTRGGLHEILYYNREDNGPGLYTPAQMAEVLFAVGKIGAPNPNSLWKDLVKPKPPLDLEALALSNKLIDSIQAEPGLNASFPVDLSLAKVGDTIITSDNTEATVVENDPDSNEVIVKMKRGAGFIQFPVDKGLGFFATGNKGAKVPEVAAPAPEGVPEYLKEAMAELTAKGWNYDKWQIIPQDLANPNVVEAIKLSPSLSPEEIDKILSFAPGGVNEIKLTPDTKIKGNNLSALDVDYLAAVESGDLETAQRMVDEAAKAAGYDVEGWHGTSGEDTNFSVFDLERTVNRDGARRFGTRYFGKGVYFATSPRDAMGYAENEKTGVNPKVIKARLKGHFFETNKEYSREEIKGLFDTTGFKSDYQKRWDTTLYPISQAMTGDYFYNYMVELYKSTDIVNEKLRNAGFTGILDEIAEDSHKGQIVVFNPNQIKSADPVTYENGEVVALSKRFDQTSDNIFRGNNLSALERWANKKAFDSKLAKQLNQNTTTSQAFFDALKAMDLSENVSPAVRRNNLRKLFNRFPDLVPDNLTMNEIVDDGNFNSTEKELLENMLGSTTGDETLWNVIRGNNLSALRTTYDTLRNEGFYTPHLYVYDNPTGTQWIPQSLQGETGGTQGPATGTLEQILEALTAAHLALGEDGAPSPFRYPDGSANRDLVSEALAALVPEREFAAIPDEMILDSGDLDSKWLDSGMLKLAGNPVLLDNGFELTIRSQDPSDNLLQFTNDLILKRHIFGDIAEELAGFTYTDEGDLVPVTRRPMMEWNPATPEQVDTLLESLGFTIKLAPNLYGHISSPVFLDTSSPVSFVEVEGLIVPREARVYVPDEEAPPPDKEPVTVERVGEPVTPFRLPPPAAPQPLNPEAARFTRWELANKIAPRGSSRNARLVASTILGVDVATDGDELSLTDNLAPHYTVEGDETAARELLDIATKGMDAAQLADFKAELKLTLQSVDFPRFTALLPTERERNTILERAGHLSKMLLGIDFKDMPAPQLPALMEAVGHPEPISTSAFIASKMQGALMAPRGMSPAEYGLIQVLVNEVIPDDTDLVTDVNGEPMILSTVGNISFIKREDAERYRTALGISAPVVKSVVELVDGPQGLVPHQSDLALIGPAPGKRILTNEYGVPVAFSGGRSWSVEMRPSAKAHLAHVASELLSLPADDTLRFRGNSIGSLLQQMEINTPSFLARTNWKVHSLQALLRGITPGLFKNTGNPTMVSHSVASSIQDLLGSEYTILATATGHVVKGPDVMVSLPATQLARTMFHTQRVLPPRAPETARKLEMEHGPASLWKTVSPAKNFPPLEKLAPADTRGHIILNRETGEPQVFRITERDQDGNATVVPAYGSDGETYVLNGEPNAPIQTVPSSALLPTLEGTEEGRLVKEMYSNRLHGTKISASFRFGSEVETGSGFVAGGQLRVSGKMDKRGYEAKLHTDFLAKGHEAAARVFIKDMKALEKTQFPEGLPADMKDLINRALGFQDTELTRKQKAELKDAKALLVRKVESNTRSAAARARNESNPGMRSFIYDRAQADEAEELRKIEIIIENKANEMRRLRRESVKRDAVAALARLPEDYRTVVSAFREQLDGIMKLISESLNLADQGDSRERNLRATIDDSYGIWFHREYEKYHNLKAWEDHIMFQRTPEAVRIYEAAYTHFADKQYKTKAASLREAIKLAVLETRAKALMEEHPGKTMAWAMEVAEVNLDLEYAQDRTDVKLSDILDVASAREYVAGRSGALDYKDIFNNIFLATGDADTAVEAIKKIKAVAATHLVTDAMIRAAMVTSLNTNGNDGMGNMDLTEGSAKLDNSVLMHRNDIPKELREFWGEYTDPVTVAVRSAMAASRYATSRMMLNELDRIGTAAGFITTDPASALDERKFIQFDNAGGAANLEVARARSGPLAHKWVDPRFNDALIDMVNPKTKETWMFTKVLARLTGFSMAAATSLSVQSYARNFLSNTFIAMGTGNFTVPDLKAFKLAWGRLGNSAALGEDVTDPDAQQLRQDIIDLAKRGVLGDNETSEMISNFLGSRLTAQEVAGEETVSNASKARKAVDKTVKGYHSFMEWAGGYYGSMDEVWRVMVYRKELQKLQEIHPGKDEDELKDIAAHNVSVTMPSFSRAAQVIRSLRRIPVIAPFVTFYAEMIRSTAGVWQIGMSEIREGNATGNEALVSNGRKRIFTNLLSMASINYLIPMVVRMLAKAFDDEDEDEEGLLEFFLREIVPDYQKNNNLVIMGSDPDAKTITLFDASFLNPFVSVTGPLFTLLRTATNPLEGEGFLERLPKATTDALEVFLDPYISEQLFSSATIDALRNTPRGNKNYDIYDPNGNFFTEKFPTGLWYIIKNSLMPGALKTGERIYKGATGKVESGRAYDALTESLAIAGLRVQKVDIDTALDQKFKGLNSQMESAVSDNLTRPIKQKTTTTRDDVLGYYKEAHAKQRKAAANIYKKIRGAKAFGYSDAELRTLLKGANVDADNAGELLRGVISKPKLSPQTHTELKKLKASDEFGNEDRRLWYYEAEGIHANTSTL
jgi:hypothetical protein